MKSLESIFPLNLNRLRGRKSHADDPNLSLLDLQRVRFQSNICRALLLPFGGFLILMMKVWRRYEIENIAECRARFKEIWKAKQKAKTPLIICANHLTFIDSALIIWALASNPWYLFNYRAMVWNLPAGDFFKKHLHYHLTLYLTKCIFLDRKGTAAHKNRILNLCRHLLATGDTVLIFPEGQRSRTGVFEHDRLRFGVGKLVSSLENAQVLCIYVRAHGQQTFSNYPAKHSRFKLRMKLFSPSVDNYSSKKVASIEVVKEIGATIKEMENEFFNETR